MKDWLISIGDIWSPDLPELTDEQWQWVMDNYPDWFNYGAEEVVEALEEELCHGQDSK